MPRDRYNPEDEFRYRRGDDEYRGRDERGRRTYARDYDYENSYREDRRRFDDLRSDRGIDDYGGDYGRARYPGPPPRYPYSRDPGPPPGRYDEDDRFSGRRDDRHRQLHGGPSRSHVRCRDIMTRDVTVAHRGTTLEQVAAMMRDEDTGVIPVVDEIVPAENEGADDRAGRGRLNRSYSNGRLVGLITDRDIVVRAIAEGMDRTAVAEEIMTTDIYTARPNDRVIEVIRTMGDKQVRRIPVVDDNNNLVGIISMADVALETENDRELADALEEISSGSSFWSKIFG